MCLSVETVAFTLMCEHVRVPHVWAARPSADGNVRACHS